MHASRLFLPLLAAFTIGAAPPPIDSLKGFQPGLWQVKPTGEQPASNICVADASLLLTGGRNASDCSFTIISSLADTAVVTYRCDSGLSGRTQIRRDTEVIYKVDSQGLEGGLPFAARSEWRRVGAC